MTLFTRKSCSVYSGFYSMCEYWICQVSYKRTKIDCHYLWKPFDRNETRCFITCVRPIFWLKECGLNANVRALLKQMTYGTTSYATTMLDLPSSIFKFYGSGCCFSRIPYVMNKMLVRNCSIDGREQFIPFKVSECRNLYTWYLVNIDSKVCNLAFMRCGDISLDVT